jgi:hypothetical protein
MSSLAIASRVRGDSAALEEGLYRGSRKTNIELFMDQLVRDAVIMVIYLDVIIDIDPGSGGGAPGSPCTSINSVS